MEKEFNPMLIDEITALLFWTLVEENGYSNTAHDVRGTQGYSILKSSNKESVFTSYKISILPENAIVAFSDQVAKYAYQKTINYENIQGILYEEDAKSGRSPSAMEINTEVFDIPLTVSGDSIQTYGKLCIRYPLPAVVIGNDEPPSDIFRVEDTSCLGFDYPMYITADEALPLESGGCFITGIFRIPENVELAGLYWRQVIPNSICTKEGMSVYYESGKCLNLKYHWGNKRENNTGFFQNIISIYKRIVLRKL